jgi:hypothetical protein
MKRNFKMAIRAQMVIRIILGALTVMVGNTVANAVTVYFNDADRLPASMLQIDGVTITDSGTAGQAGQPTTVQGVGLGFDDGVGFAGEVDMQAHWSAGEMTSDSVLGGDGLYFNVNGYINSITIMPVMRILSSTGSLMTIPDGLSLEFSCSTLLSGGPNPEFSANTSSPMTLAVDNIAVGSLSACYLTPQMDWSPDYWFANYRNANLSQEQTLQWGFTVLSLDYTPVPTSVPEASPTTYLMAGLIGLLFVRRWRKVVPQPRFARVRKGSVVRSSQRAE